ncbi:MAG: DUF2851 family protein [Bacteroidia bacterium]
MGRKKEGEGALGRANQTEIQERKNIRGDTSKAEDFCLPDIQTNGAHFEWENSEELVGNVSNLVLGAAERGGGHPLGVALVGSEVNHGTGAVKRPVREGAGLKSRPKVASITSGYKNENEFHRAWLGLHFERSGLRTTLGESLKVLNPGRLNLNHGPDFLDAEIMIGRTRHCGHVELHLHESDWYAHGHHLDRQYSPVVLHVFLKGGATQASRIDGTLVSSLCLEGRIRPSLGQLGSLGLPCGDFGRLSLPENPSLWLENAGIGRMKAKAQQLMEKLKAIHYDWSQLLWEELAVSLGGPVNGEHFRTLAQKAPWSVVRKYVHSRICLEAILFGQAGMLEGAPLDHYQRELQDNWRYLKAKHGLRLTAIPFKFHRMRPAGLPATRIAQLAMLAETYRPLCQLLEKDFATGFVDAKLEVGDYWAVHYDFGNTLNERRMEFGRDSRHRLAVNVLAPLGILGWREAHLTWDSSQSSSEEWRTVQVANWLRELPPEANQITRKFSALGLAPTNALQAQGMIGIYKTECSRLGCLTCEVGSRFLAMRS